MSVETEVRSRSPWGLARRWPKSLAVPRTRPQVAMTAAHKRLAAFSPFGWSRHLPRVAADPHIRSGSHIPHRASAATPYRRSAPLVHERPAVDDQRLPGDEVALRRGEEDDRADQILRLLHALKRSLPGGGGAHPDDALARILLRERAARRDAVDADAVLPELARERAREAQHARFRGDVVDAARRALQRRARADVDDLPVAALAHMRDHGARSEPGAAQVDRHHAVPFLDLDLVEGRPRHRHGGEDRCVVHEDIDLPEGLDRGLRHRFHARPVGDVGARRDPLETLTPQVYGGGFSGDCVDLCDDDLRAFSRQSERVGLAEAVPAARDDRHLSRQPTRHAFSPSNASLFGSYSAARSPPRSRATRLRAAGYARAPRRARRCGGARRSDTDAGRSP